MHDGRGGDRRCSTCRDSRRTRPDSPISGRQRPHFKIGMCANGTAGRAAVSRLQCDGGRTEVGILLCRTAGTSSRLFEDDFNLHRDHSKHYFPGLVTGGLGVFRSFSAMLFGDSPVSIAVLEDTLVIMPFRNLFGSRRWGLLIVSGTLLMGEHGTTRAMLRYPPDSRAPREDRQLPRRICGSK